MTPDERLDELESDPYDHDRLDIESLFEATGFRCEKEEEPHMDVWVHDEWGLAFTLDTRRRRVPVRYLQDIIGDIRRNLRSEDG